MRANSDAAWRALWSSRATQRRRANNSWSEPPCPHTKEVLRYGGEKDTYVGQCKECGRQRALTPRYVDNGR